MQETLYMLVPLQQADDEGENLETFEEFWESYLVAVEQAKADIEREKHK